MRKKWRIILGILLLLIILGVAIKSCGKKKSAAVMPDTGSETVIVTRGEISSKTDISGEVQPQTVVSLKSKVSGKIVKFYADENDYVKAGQIIADIEPDYNQANTLFNTKAQLQRAEMQLSNAKKDLNDKALLLQKKYISQDEYNKASDALQTAQIEFAQATRQYEMISDLDVPGKVTHVYATSSGVVIQRNINEGEMVQSSISSYGEGTVIMKIADLSNMIVKSNINEVDIAKFHTGQEAEITLDAIPYQQFKGRIIKIAPQASSVNNAKVFPVEISINAEGKTAKPGMTANVSIMGESRKDVLVIPIRAVFSNDQNQDIVYLVKDSTATAVNTKAKKGAKIAPTGVATPVKLGANNLQQVEVIEGLKEKDRILLNEPSGKPNFGMMM
jgi:HlyD family secretion protein